MIRYQKWKLTREELERIAAGRLGVIHRRVGMLEQDVEIVAVAGEQADADTDRRDQLMPVDEIGPVQALQDLARDMRAPVVSLSFGLPAIFLFGGLQRTGKNQRYRLAHGDVVVWGGPSRLAFHGILPLAHGDHALVGQRRLNVTFRRVLPP